MADEFIKGFGILTTAGLAWMVLAGWYNTPTFEGAQLIGEASGNLGTYGNVAIALKEIMFWFAVLGALTFWVLVPAVKQAREAYVE